MVKCDKSTVLATYKADCCAPTFVLAQFEGERRSADPPRYDSTELMAVGKGMGAELGAMEAGSGGSNSYNAEVLADTMYVCGIARSECSNGERHNEE